MTSTFQFDPVELPPECKELRQEVRAFLKQEIEAGTEGAGLDLLLEKGADLLAQFLALGRQLDRIELESGCHYSLTILVFTIPG